VKEGLIRRDVTQRLQFEALAAGLGEVAAKGDANSASADRDQWRFNYEAEAAERKKLATALENTSTELTSVRNQRDAANTERDNLKVERDNAEHARQQADAALTAAIQERDRVRTERDDARRERDNKTEELEALKTTGATASDAGGDKLQGSHPPAP
jgi:chromosome segregation ATPase